MFKPQHRFQLQRLKIILSGAKIYIFSGFTICTKLNLTFCPNHRILYLGRKTEINGQINHNSITSDNLCRNKCPDQMALKPYTRIKLCSSGSVIH